MLAEHVVWPQIFYGGHVSKKTPKTYLAKASSKRLVEPSGSGVALLPSGNLCQFAIENGHSFVVSFPMNPCDFP